MNTAKPVSLNLNVRGLGQSATLAVKDKCRALAREGRAMYDFGLGQSPFPVTAHLRLRDVPDGGSGGAAGVVCGHPGADRTTAAPSARGGGPMRAPGAAKTGPNVACHGRGVRRVRHNGLQWPAHA
jgi:hypothetical protein